MITLIAWIIGVTARWSALGLGLTKEALDKHWAIVSWMHFEGTDECKREESQYDNRSIKRSSRGSSKDGYEH